ncbi:TPA: hypothetical protein ACH3X3_010648 [Trebouxia sp. C0006]
MQQVKHFWDSTTEQQRTELLTLDIDCLNKQAARLPDQKRVAKVLAQGIRRLAQTGTWKQWQWDASSKPHTTAASFRDWVVQQRVPHALQSLLQQAQESTVSTEALHKLQNKLLVLKKNRRSAVINIIFALLTSQEHGFLHHAFGCPVNQAVWTLLPPDERSEEPPAENEDFVLDFEDIDTLPAQDLDRITAWMEGLLANLCQLGNLQRLEREHNQAELFSLSPDGTKLKINPEALFQRQTVLVNKHCNSPDSVLPFPAQHELRSGPSSTSAGPVLDWIYGYKAVPTQSKPLPVAQSFDVLKSCLKRMAQKQAEIGDGRLLIQDMVQGKQHVAICESSLGRSLKPSWPNHEATELQHSVMMSLLQQELAITAARRSRLSHHLKNKMFPRIFRLNQELSQARAEAAFWSAKDQRLQKGGV